MKNTKPPAKQKSVPKPAPQKKKNLSGINQTGSSFLQQPPELIVRTETVKQPIVPSSPLDRVIYFSTDFNEESCTKLCQKLTRMDWECPDKDIVIMMSSPGGCVYSMSMLIDCIKLCRCRVAVIATGLVASAAAVTLCSGTKGLRFATRHSCIMIHGISSFQGFQTIQDQSIEITHTENLQKMLSEILLHNTKIKKTDLDKFVSKNNYLTAVQAKELGVIDHIIDSFDDLIGHLNIFNKDEDEGTILEVQ